MQLIIYMLIHKNCLVKTHRAKTKRERSIKKFTVLNFFLNVWYCCYRMRATGSGALATVAAITMKRKRSDEERAAEKKQIFMHGTHTMREMHIV